MAIDIQMNKHGIMAEMAPDGINAPVGSGRKNAGGFSLMAVEGTSVGVIYRDDEFGFYVGF
jgi:hypothetical protein